MKKKFDLLREIADLAYQIAPCHCHQIESSTSCRPYHAAWPYLRLAGVVSGAQADADFFQDSFDKFANLTDNSSILIAGAADHAILEQVALACQRCSVQPNITVVDHCDTPLQINLWFAQQIGIKIKTIKSDLLSFDNFNKFDLLVAHSIFSFIPHDEHQQLINKWSSLLKPNAFVIMSQAFRPGYIGPTLRRFSEAEVDIFANRFLMNAKSNIEKFGLSEVALLDLARDFAKYKTSYTLIDKSVLQQKFEFSGFSLENFYAINRQKHQIQSASPDSSDSMFTLRMVARRI